MVNYKLNILISLISWTTLTRYLNLDLSLRQWFWEWIYLLIDYFVTIIIYISNKSRVKSLVMENLFRKSTIQSDMTKKSHDQINLITNINTLVIVICCTECWLIMSPSGNKEETGVPGNSSLVKVKGSVMPWRSKGSNIWHW
jgi:hypothetical protein